MLSNFRSVGNHVRNPLPAGMRSRFVSRVSNSGVRCNPVVVVLKYAFLPLILGFFFIMYHLAIHTRNFFSRVFWYDIRPRVAALNEEDDDEIAYPPIINGLRAAYEPPIAFDGQTSHPAFQWWNRGVYLWQRVVAVGSLVAVYITWCLRTMNLTFYDLFVHPRVPSWFLLFLLCFFLLVWFKMPTRTRVWVPYPIQSSQLLRQHIREIVIPASVKPANFHSHPETAASRNNADDAINNFVTLNGLEVYSVQMSSRDIDRNVQGSLTHLWDQDRHNLTRNDPLRINHVLKFTNVDYYVRWEDYLWTGLPILLYTLTPQDPCGTFQETQWTTNVDNTITMFVTGGGKYTHQLWDYEVDDFRAHYPGVTIIYSVESVPVNDHWSIVLINPKQAIPNPSNLSGHTLKRKQLVHKCATFDGSTRYAAMIKHNGPAAVLSLSAPGEVASIRLTAKTQTILGARIRIGKLQLCDLVQLLAPDFGNDTRLAQALIYNAYPAIMPANVPRASVFTNREVAHSYGKLPEPTLVPKEKLAITILSPPILGGVCAPVKSRANDLWCVDKRITSVANPQAKFIGKYQLYASEFIKCVFPDNGQLFPVTVSQVYDSQSRPTQRAANDRALPSLSSWTVDMDVEVKSFQKAELYASCKDPRNISTLPPEHCLTYSQYTQALSAYLKRYEWYAFGRHPNDIARRVNFIANKAKFLVETDFSRFDGTHSRALYDLELSIMLRAFPVCEHETIRRVQACMYNAQARTTEGVRYSIGGSRLSGAADTSVCNTIDNAFVAYCAARQTGLSIQNAFVSLGLYGGDDGISIDIPSKVYEMVCSDLGLTLKARATMPHERVSFLGRIYPNPMGHTGHMADLPRQLPKLCAHGGITMDKIQALRNKAAGHLVMDATTPVLGDWARMITRLYGTGDPTQVELSYTAKATVLFKDVGKGTHVLSIGEMMGVACDMLDVDCETIDRYVLHLQTIERLEELLPLKTYVPEVLPPAVRMGDNVGELKRSETKAPIGQPFMTTKSFEADQLVAFVREHMPGDVLSLVDATAYLGNDTITLANAFSDAVVTAYELHPPHAVECAKNLREALPNRTVNCQAGEFTTALDTTSTDLLYLDPPWVGGQSYLDFPEQMATMGAKALSSLMLEAVQHKRAVFVVAKVPVNYNFTEHSRLTSGLFSPTLTVRDRAGKASFVLLGLGRAAAPDTPPVVSTVPIMPPRPIAGPPDPKSTPAGKLKGQGRVRKPRVGKSKHS
jgi:hypothetical protein